MKFNKIFMTTIFCLVLMSVFMIPATLGANDLTVSLGQLPGLAESPTKGILVDLVKTMDSYYPGNIKIEVVPFLRSVTNVIEGKADFHIPLIRTPYSDVNKLPYDFVPEELGKVAYVLYTNPDKKVLDTKNLAQYNLETLRGHASYFNMKVSEVDTVEQGLAKLVSGRIDGFIDGQEGTDPVIKTNKYKNIRRQFYMEFDSCIIVPKNASGRNTKAIINDILKKMKTDKSLYKFVGKSFLVPYDDWQPSKMGW